MSFLFGAICLKSAAQERTIPTINNSTDTILVYIGLANEFKVDNGISLSEKNVSKDLDIKEKDGVISFAPKKQGVFVVKFKSSDTKTFSVFVRSKVVLPEGK